MKVFTARKNYDGHMSNDNCLDTTCVRKYRELGLKGDKVAMKMVEAINAKNLIRIKMMDFMTTVVMVEQWRRRG